MAAFINTNTASLNAQRNLNTSQTALTTSLQRLSSGLRINSAKDDAAGLAISERMSSQIRGNDQAARNANDGISLAQTAEGDMAQIGTNLQRMRELAVQASNGTNSASDRAALNNEVQSLAAEIDRVAQNSSFNGVKLLDGSFSAQDFQIGANNTANDRITIDSIASARTSSLGGVGTSYAATKQSGATTGALAAGDLTLNGFQVGASSLGAGPGQTTSSAFSLAAAINNISASSGVSATADVNTVTGGTITAFTAIAADTFSINGVNVGAIAAGTSDDGQGANVAAAINLLSTQTGVTATANASSGAISLSAADGRDIKLSLNVSAGATTAATQMTNLLAKTGLAAADVGAAGSTTIASGAFTTVASVTGTDKYKVTVDGLSFINATVGAGTTSAAAMDTAATAFVAANTGYKITGTFAGGDAQITKTDGTAIVINQAVTDAAGTGAAAGAITSGTVFGIAAATVVAGIAGISGTTTAGNFGATAGMDSLSNHGTISLSSTSADGIVWAGAAATKAGLAASGTSSATVTSSVSSLATMNVTTASGAASAISAIDGALATVNSSRASLGAYQNRFASVVSSLQTTSENLSASRSRIQDTDFAQETAALTRGQILQQAGTAMLAQANSLPNGVLALLRG
ncbi:MAG: flagellin [Telluria sp.]|nr:flagellin [Telluria sp.]